MTFGLIEANLGHKFFAPLSDGSTSVSRLKIRGILHLGIGY
jgi:hypothetical protein